jgi:hypothetical protein
MSLEDDLDDLRDKIADARDGLQDLTRSVNNKLDWLMALVAKSIVDQRVQVTRYWDAGRYVEGPARVASSDGPSITVIMENGDAETLDVTGVTLL